METQHHVSQMQLLIEPLRLYCEDQQDVYVGGNMFMYVSLAQVRHQDFRRPDFFAVLDVPKRERESWVVWEEGKGPDIVIELLSESTASPGHTMQSHTEGYSPSDTRSRRCAPRFTSFPYQWRLNRVAQDCSALETVCPSQQRGY